MKYVRLVATGLSLSFVLVIAFASSCSELTPAPAATGGSSGQGGATSKGGTTTVGGMTSAGGTMIAGGAISTGGNASGGLSAAGGTTVTGGMTSTTGAATTGGSPSTGGTTAAGGSAATGGASSDTGAGSPDGGEDVPATGGVVTGGGTSESGGTAQPGGNTSFGGTSNLGGTSSAAGTSSSGGTTSSGGTSNSGGTTNSGGISSSGGTIGPVTTNCPGAAPAGITTSWCSCATTGSTNSGGYTYFNNIWGSGPGPQCIWTTTTNKWGVAANHPTTSNIKSYANISSFPQKAINAINSYTSAFDVTVPSSGSWETTYDIFVKNNTTPPPAQSIEVMLWMNKNGPVQPIAAVTGSSGPVADQTNVSVGGHTWNVYSGNSGGDIVTFVRTSNTNSGSVNIKDILTWLTGNHTANGVFTSSWTLDLVQFGFEITSDGSTQAFVTNSYSVTSN